MRRSGTTGKPQERWGTVASASRASSGKCAWTDFGTAGDGGAGLRPAGTTSGRPSCAVLDAGLETRAADGTRTPQRVPSPKRTNCRKPSLTSANRPFTLPAKQRRARQAGFTLLEMIVATALLGMAIVGLLSLISGALSNAARVREYDRAAMLARTKMNELLTVTPLPLAQELSGTFDANSGWTARLTPFEVLTRPAPGMPMLVRVHLNIWWRTGGRRRNIELESYRSMLIRPEHESLLSGFGGAP